MVQWCDVGVLLDQPDLLYWKRTVRTCRRRYGATPLLAHRLTVSLETGRLGDSSGSRASVHLSKHVSRAFFEQTVSN